VVVTVNDAVQINDLGKFLAGSRRAIERFGRWRGTIWLGLIFVVSAGFAREYDQEDLLHEPWYLVLPLAASLATSFILYAWLFLECWRSGVRGLGSFLPGYWQFLGWYWLTAPLAWLYAVPYEQFFSPLAAMQLNYLTLAIVAFWRVVLMIRVAQIAYGMRVDRAAILVLTFATVVAFAAVNIAPKPIFDVMAGVRLSDEESFIQGVWLLVTFVGFWIGLALLLCSLGVFSFTQPRTLAPSNFAESQQGSATLWAFATAGLVVWLPLLAWTQPAEQRRWHAERMLRAGQVEAALRYLSQFERKQLPAHFNPPPHLAYREFKPDLAEIVVSAQRAHVAAWVREIFQAKWESQMFDWGYYRHPYAYAAYSDNQLKNLLKLIENRPDRAAIAKDILRRLKSSLEEEGTAATEGASAERTALIEQFERLAEKTQDYAGETVP
jgi:hypothetical protein